jgi:hypothetical protein
VQALLKPVHAIWDQPKVAPAHCLLAAVEDSMVRGNKLQHTARKRLLQRSLVAVCVCVTVCVCVFVFGRQARSKSACAHRSAQLSTACVSAARAVSAAAERTSTQRCARHTFCPGWAGSSLPLLRR